MFVGVWFGFQCNNPKTKEPKLDAAMRIIPEWKDRDQEIRRLWDKYNKKDTASDSTKQPEQNVDASTTASECNWLVLVCSCILKL